jgi:hypothetical protein
MTKRSCALALFALLAACGGGGSDDGGGGGGGGGGSGGSGGTPTITVGTTIVEAGASGSISAAVGDTLTIKGSEVIPGLQMSHDAGQTCSLSYPSGIQTNVDTYVVKIGTGTTQCILKFTFASNAVATLAVNVP